MTRRGKDIIAAYDQRLREMKDALPVLTRCANCSWTLEGTLADTRDAHRAHRLTRHPELVVRPRKRPHARALVPTTSNIDANIAKARSQGAATWDGVND
jgi:bacterioferritin-associated ferredoxin